MAYTKSPNMSVKEYDPFGNLTGSYFSPITSYQSTNGLDIFNPVALTDLASANIGENQINATLDATYNMAKGLTFKGTVSYIYLASTLSMFLPREAIGIVV